MKPAERQLLFDELMKGSLDVCRGNPHELVLFEQSTNEDLDCVEPVIDKIIADEKEALLARHSRDGWKEGGLELVVIPDGVQCLVHISFEGRHVMVQIDRSRLRDFGNYLMLEAAK